VRKKKRKIRQENWPNDLRNVTLSIEGNDVEEDGDREDSSSGDPVGGRLLRKTRGKGLFLLADSFGSEVTAAATTRGPALKTV